jgi:hypothetical protein
MRVATGSPQAAPAQTEHEIHVDRVAGLSALRRTEDQQFGAGSDWPDTSRSSQRVDAARPGPVTGRQAVLVEAMPGVPAVPASGLDRSRFATPESFGTTTRSPQFALRAS